MISAPVTPIQTDLSLVLDSLPQAVIVVGADYAVKYVNAAAEVTFGLSGSQMTRKGLKAALSANSPIFELVDRVFGTRSPVNEYQIDISTPRTGAGRIVDIYGAHMGSDGSHAVLIFRERSMADRIARQLSHRTAARSVTGLAAMLAHEIKNPLSGIRGAAQLLDGVVDAENQELTKLITTETDRVVKIVDRMEVFSDDTPVQFEPVNMHSVLEQVRRIASAGFANNVQFVENYDPSLPPVSGSHDELVQVLLNLVKNAAEALNKTASPRITLTSAYRPGFHVLVPGSSRKAELPLEFTVADNGPGIPEEIRNDIFEPFVTSRINGSGLGLALVAKMIGKHGGVIEHDNTGDGALFRVLLPAWQETSHINTEQNDV